MEQFDLERFLESHGDDDISVPHRTVDEILLLHDCSSSPPSGPTPSPSPSPSSQSSPSKYTTSTARPATELHQPFNRLPFSHHHSSPTKVDVFTLSESRRLSKSPSLDTNLSNFSIDTTNPIPDPRIKTPALSLSPHLFAAMRSNAKPGAALAAAAAASLSIPTSRVNCIKSSRSTRTDSAAHFTVLNHSKTSSASAAPSNCPSHLQVELEKEIDDGTGASRDPFFTSLDVATVQDEGLNGPSQTSQLTNQTTDRVCEQVVDGHDHVSPISSASVASHSEDTAAGVEGFPEFELNCGNSPIGVDLKSEGDSFYSLCLHQDSISEGSPYDSGANDTAPEVEVMRAADSGEGEVLREDITSAIEHRHNVNDATYHLNDNASSSGGNEDDSISAAAISATIHDFSLNIRTMNNSSPPSLRPLELAEEFEKRQASTGMHWEEGAAAQLMRLEAFCRGPIVMGYFNVDANNIITRTISNQTFRRDHGFPMVIAIHVNYITVGMSKGLIMVIASKYSPSHTDIMDSKMLMLGLQGDRAYVPVTSMCFNQQGDLLFAGYGDGHCSVWDVQKASLLKVITDQHRAPVVHLLYLGQDAQSTRQFNVVSGDSNGVVKLLRFSIVPWVNRISLTEATKLLDEKTSTVVCASPLQSGDVLGGALLSSNGNGTVSSSAIGSMMRGVIAGDSGSKNSSAEEGVVIFVTHQSALVAKVSPVVDVYATIPRPDDVEESSMPYAAWKSVSETHLLSTETSAIEASGKYSFLALAWQRKVQVAKLVKSKLTVHWNWTLESPASGVAWLDDQMLVVLTVAGQLYLFAKDGKVINQTSYSTDGSRVDDLMAYHTYFTNGYGNPKKAHHNCLAVRGATIYLLGPSELVVSRLLPWRERIELLRGTGDWMAALGMALTLYNGQAHGVIDLPRSLDDIQKAVMPYLAELILSYVDEVFSYVEVACGHQIGASEQSDESKSKSSSDYLDIKEQCIRVGGVAVEFCVHINRTDILFDEIYSKFDAAKHRETFLELLEPYILKDMLGSLPPVVMQALVEHYSSKGWLQRVERCVLHMDISSLDFNQVVRLCREHRLHGALIYLFNKGLDDFTTPLEELLLFLRDCTREIAAGLGYRILVYLKYCFKGLAFPPGHGILSPLRLPSLRTELLQFLLLHSSAPNFRAVTDSFFSGPYPNLYHLLELDTEATLDVLSCAFEEHEVPDSKDLIHSHLGSTEIDNRVVETQSLVQELVDVLSPIIDMSCSKGGFSSTSNDVSSADSWPSRRDVALVFDFMAYYVSCQRAMVPQDVLRKMLEYLTSDYYPLPNGTFGTPKEREKQLLKLLEVVPCADWDASNLLQMCEKAHFHQVCGFIHATRRQYLASLTCYMKSVDEPVHAFSFIHYILKQKSDEESVAFRAEVMVRIPDLVKLNRQGAFFLVFELFNGQGPLKMLSELHSHPESLFLYLKTLAEANSTGTLDFSCLCKNSLDDTFIRKARYQSDTIQAYMESLNDFQKILRSTPIHMTEEMTEIYLELLCRYQRESVLKFLESLESYRVENCLRLCQDYGIVDAAAFLLERVGDVGSALSLILSGLNDKFVLLENAVIEKLGNSEEFNLLVTLEEVKDLLDVLHSCIKLCQRNSPRIEPHESEHIWFQLLDSFCEPLIGSWSDKPKTTTKIRMDVLRQSSSKQECEVGKITWRIPNHKFANVLRKLFSMLIKEIIEGMIGYVCLSAIMLKLLSDNGCQEFGDFKLTILGMLGIYDFERRILDTAKSLIEDDMYYTMSLLKKGASHGYAPRSLLCCVCSSPLTKGPHGSSLHVFSCGHAVHTECELPENETSIGGSSSGCPTCVPKKRSERSRTMFLLSEDGTLGNISSRSDHCVDRIGQASGMLVLHTRDQDVLEKTFSSHPISRFEILNNLREGQRSIQVENMPLLKLSPPAVYHEKVKKRNDVANGESSRGSSIQGTTKGRQQLRDLKVKGSSVRFTLRSNLFGKENKGKQ